MASKKSAGSTTMTRIKNEAANEVGVTLKEGYNGDLTSKQAGSVGGQMVKKMTTIRNINCRRIERTKSGHSVTIQYNARLC